ncbi:response regulator [Actinoplanes sp. GCM10030250]|uniref:response regulator n=1 Tax=Actinoplanes sp. GCM10030250 TaxID=3273376 RepID=UPI003623764A
MALIVAVEDQVDIRDILVRVLKRAGHTVVEAADGAAGLQAVRKHQPDLVISDIDMPVMSGVEMSQAIRRDPESGKLPVIFVSGSLTPGDPRPVQGQVTAVLLKPFTPKELLACVEKVLAGEYGDGREPAACP